METAVNLVTDDPHSLGHTLFDISHFILAVVRPSNSSLPLNFFYARFFVGLYEVIVGFQ